MQMDPASVSRSAFEPGNASRADVFATTASLPEAAEHLVDLDLPNGEQAPSSYLATLAPRRGSVITPAVLHVLEWHRQHDRPR